MVHVLCNIIPGQFEWMNNMSSNFSTEYVTAAKKKYDKVENDTDAKLMFAHSQSQMNR